ncbi:hypothetical protein ACFQ3Z_24760 [Streptomyces nogalater]
MAPYAGVSGAWFGTTHHCLEDLAVLRSVPGVTIAAPYGEAEMRAVIRSAVRSGRPHYIRTGRNAAYESLPVSGTGLPPVTWESEGDPGDVCLVSVGEEGTRLSLAARAATGVSTRTWCTRTTSTWPSRPRSWRAGTPGSSSSRNTAARAEWPKRWRCCCPGARSPRWRPPGMALDRRRPPGGHGGARPRSARRARGRGEGTPRPAVGGRRRVRPRLRPLNPPSRTASPSHPQEPTER